MDRENLFIKKPSPPLMDGLINKSYRLPFKPTLHIGKAATKAFGTLGDLLHTSAVTHSVVDFWHHTKQAKQSAKEYLNQRIEHSSQLLASVNTVFPITLFPDTIAIDRTKVTITRRNFFWSAEVMSLRIEDILSVSAAIGPFFGSVTIASRVMSTIDHFTTHHFWRSDAIALARIVQGAIIARQNQLELDDMPVDELVQTLMKIGHETS